MVFTTIKVMVHARRYLAICCDKVMMIDNQSCVNIHAHLVDGFECISILLDLKRPTDGGTINNLTNGISKKIMIYGGLITKNISNKLIYISSNDVVPFINVHYGICKKKFLCMFVVHYVTHLINMFIVTHIYPLHPRNNLSSASCTIE
jgi:hypothetical protein